MVKVLMVKCVQSIFPIMTGEGCSCSVRIEILQATGVWISISYPFYTRFSIDEDSSVPFVYTFTLQLSNPAFQLLTPFKVSIGCALLLQLVSTFRTNSVDFFLISPSSYFRFYTTSRHVHVVFACCTLVHGSIFSVSFLEYCYISDP